MWPTFRGKLTYVIDDRLAILSNENFAVDSVAVARAAGGEIDPATIRDVEVIPATLAVKRYPMAEGPVIRVTRCYASRSQRVRPDER